MPAAGWMTNTPKASEGTATSVPRSQSTLDPDLAAWIESTVGGRIVSRERQGRWREQWFIDVDCPSGLRRVLARFPRIAGTRPANEPIDRHKREAAILQALDRAGIRVPHFYGMHDRSLAILMDQVEGSADFSLIDGEPARDKIKREFFAELAKVHTLDVDDLDLGIPRPTNAEDLALAKYRKSLDLYVSWRPNLAPDPLLDFGYTWLVTNFPKQMDRMALILADVGPGQFLCEGDRLTALIDFEMGLIGDPMLDFGNMRMRNTLYPIGPLTPYFSHYEECSGISIDADALQYYTIASGVLNPVNYVRVIQRPTNDEQMMVACLGWDATLRRLLCEAMLETYGIETAAPVEPEPISPEIGDLHDLLAESLQQLHESETIEYREYQVRAALGVATVLRNNARVSAAIDAANLEDLSEVLGRRQTDAHDAYAEISRSIWSGSAPPVAKLFPALYRISSRREHLLKPLMIAQASEPMEPLPEYLRDQLTAPGA